LKERRKANNQKSRPKDHTFAVKRPAISTTNKDQFGQKGTPYAQKMNPQAETVANSFAPADVCGNSTSNEFHSGRQGPRADLAKWPEGFKLQGPLYGVTNYAVPMPLRRTSSQIQGNTKRWYPLQLSTNTLWACLTAAAAQAGLLTKGNSQREQT
jgi:hypothetical protein